MTALITARFLAIVKCSPYSVQSIIDRPSYLVYMDIKQLCVRYNLGSRQAIYDRIKALGITLKKDGNKSFADEEQIEALDQLNEHLNNGGTLKNFAPILNTTSIVDTVQPTLDTSLDTVQPVLDNNTLTLALIDYLANLNQRLPLDNYRDLEEAAQKKWILSSRQIEKLLGVKPHGQTFTRGNWTFTKVGKIGSENGYLVSHGQG